MLQQRNFYSVHISLNPKNATNSQQNATEKFQQRNAYHRTKKKREKKMRGLEGRRMEEIEGEEKRRNMNRGGSKRGEEEGGSIGITC